MASNRRLERHEGVLWFFFVSLVALIAYGLSWPHVPAIDERWVPTTVNLPYAAMLAAVVAFVGLGPLLWSTKALFRAPEPRVQGLAFRPRRTSGQILRLFALLAATTAFTAVLVEHPAVHSVKIELDAPQPPPCHPVGTISKYLPACTPDQVYPPLPGEFDRVASIAARRQLTNSLLLFGLAGLGVVALALAVSELERPRLSEVVVDGQGLVLVAARGRRRIAWSSIARIERIRDPWLDRLELRLTLVNGETVVIAADGSTEIELLFLQEDIAEVRDPHPVEEVPESDLEKLRQLGARVAPWIAER